MATAAKGVFFEDLSVGQKASLSKTVTEADIVAFAEVSGDKNPVHLDARYAAGTMFRERIAHGMPSAAYISAVFSMKLPGPGAIYISQTLNFKAPVKIGDTVRASVTVAEIMRRGKRVRLTCQCSVGETVVLEGEAMIKVPSRSEQLE
jgi:3-hydroxybutyryl-CoA dehydratase